MSTRPRKFQTGGTALTAPQVGQATVPRAVTPAAPSTSTTGTTGTTGGTGTTAAQTGSSSTGSGMSLGNIVSIGGVPVEKITGSQWQMLGALFPDLGNALGPYDPAKAAAQTQAASTPAASTPAASTTPLSDQDIMLQSADKLRTAAANLTTGPTPVGGAAAQQAQQAATKTTGAARGGRVRRFQQGGQQGGQQQQNPGEQLAQQLAQITAQTAARDAARRQAIATAVAQGSGSQGMARGGRTQSFQEGGKADDDDSGKPDPNVPDDRAEEFTSAQRKALGPYPEHVNVAGVLVPGASGTWDPNFLGKGEGEYLPKPDSFLPQQLDEFREFLNRNQETLRNYREARDRENIGPEARTPTGILWKDLPPDQQALRPPRGLPFSDLDNDPGSYILLKDLLRQDPNYKIPPSRPLLGYGVNPQSREYEVPRPQLGLEYRKAKGGRIRRFQAGGANNPANAPLTAEAATPTAPTPLDPLKGNYGPVNAAGYQTFVPQTAYPKIATPAGYSAFNLPAAPGQAGFSPQQILNQLSEVYSNAGSGFGTTAQMQGVINAAQQAGILNPQAAAYLNQNMPSQGTFLNSGQWNNLVSQLEQLQPSLNPATYQQGNWNSAVGGFTQPGSTTPSYGSYIGGSVAPDIANTNPGGIGASPGTFTSNATGAGVGTGSGTTGTTAATTSTPQVAQSPTGSAGSGGGLGFRKGGKMAQHRPRRFQMGGANFGAAPGGSNWQQALQQMLQNAQGAGGAVPGMGQGLPPMGQGGMGGGLPPGLMQMLGAGGGGGMGGAQGMGAAAGAMNPSPGAAAMGAMAGASPGMGQPQMGGPAPGSAAAGMGAMAGAMPGSPGAAAMGALAGASQGTGAMGGPQNWMQALMGNPQLQQQAAGALQGLQGMAPQQFQGGMPQMGQQGGMGGTFGPRRQGGGERGEGNEQGEGGEGRGGGGQQIAPGAGAGPGSTYGAAATPNQQWGQMLLGSAPGTGLMGNQGVGQNPMAQQALYRNYLGQLQGGLGMTPGAVAGGGMGMAHGGSVPPAADEHGDVGSHYRVPMRGGEHERAAHPDQQWGLIADGERRGYQTGGKVDAAPSRHATGVRMSSAPKGGQPSGTVSKFNSNKGAPGNLATKAAGRGRGFAKGGVNRTLDSTKPAPGNLATSQAGKDRFADGGVAAFAAGGAKEAVRPKTSKTVLRRRPAPAPHSPSRRPVPTPPYRDQDNQDVMDLSAPLSGPPAAPGPSPMAGPPPMAKGGDVKFSTPEVKSKVCASCGKAHGGACKGMARGGKFAGAKQRAIRRAGGGKWIQGAIKKPGALRAQLGAKSGEPIPAGKLAKAAKAPGKLGQRARLAQTLKGFKHAKGGAASCPDCGKQHSGSCKMAAGGVAKVRKGFPNTLKAPKRLARGGTVRGGGAAKRGLKFSGVF